jgi:hypothetical protein
MQTGFIAKFIVQAQRKHFLDRLEISDTRNQGGKGD